MISFFPSNHSKKERLINNQWEVKKQKDTGGHFGKEKLSELQASIHYPSSLKSECYNLNTIEYNQMESSFLMIHLIEEIQVN